MLRSSHTGLRVAALMYRKGFVKVSGRAVCQIKTQPLLLSLMAPKLGDGTRPGKKGKPKPEDELQTKSPAEFFAEHRTMAGFDNVRSNASSAGMQSDPNLVIYDLDIACSAARQVPLYNRPGACGECFGLR